MSSLVIYCPALCHEERNNDGEKGKDGERREEAGIYSRKMCVLWEAKIEKRRQLRVKEKWTKRKMEKRGESEGEEGCVV